MSNVAMDARPVDFILCQYVNSKNLFRGLKKSWKHPCGVCLGRARIPLGVNFQIPSAPC